MRVVGFDMTIFATDTLLVLYRVAIEVVCYGQSCGRHLQQSIVLTQTQSMDNADVV